MASNIFLDFLNRDSRQIFGLFDYASEVHRTLLTDALNVAAFLCDEYCIVPPGFIAECDIARAAVNRRIDYVYECLIRFPLREDSIDAFFKKKEEEYGSVADSYAGLFDAKIRSFFKKHPKAFIRRESRIGDEMVDSWEEGPDSDDFWKALVKECSTAEIERVRNIPRSVRERGSAVTWAAIKQELLGQTHPNVQRIRHGVQHEYFSIYLREYDLQVVRNLPFSRYEFGLTNRERGYDYELLRSSLSTIKCWHIVIGMSAQSMIRLRRLLGYRRFRDAWGTMAACVDERKQVQELFSHIESAYRQAFRGLESDVTSTAAVIAPARGLTLSNEQIEMFADRLHVAADAILEYLVEHKLVESGKSAKTRSLSRRRSMVQDGRIQSPVAVFCALAEERRVLEDRWKLVAHKDSPYWSGNIAGVDVLLFTADQMGRVPAAIATLRFLEEVQTGVIVVAGIAGGFAAEGVRLGDVIIAQNVADLASRKIREGEEGMIPEFRPRPFNVDGRLHRFVNSPKFDRATWEQNTQKDAEWPDGLRPKIHSGTIASLDEVVSSDEWVKALCLAWPQLKGVEMEAGGVCAAADEHDAKVIVVRGVSDLADPAKSDTEWRRRATKTVAGLLEMAFENGVF